jgi:phosphatidylglycerol---prolipoprotein diacylglyceryl transferase
MYPILIQIGPVKLYSSHFFLFLAILIGIVFASREVRRTGFSKRDIGTFWVAVIPFALVIGFLNGLLFWSGFGGRMRDFLSLFSGGLISFGVVLGALFLGWALATLRKQPVGPVLDLISLTLPLMLAVYRVGCLLNGCCFGVETQSFLGMDLPGQNGEWAFRYPTQIIYIVFDVALFVWQWLYRSHKPFGGSLTLAFLMVFSLGRLLIDILRDLPSVLGPFSLQQLTSIAILSVTLYIYFELWLLKRLKGT